MSDDRIMPCGCVVCVCEDEMQCHGCGAKACEAHDRIMNPLKYPSSPHALTREQCSLCTANRPRLCDQHYKQGADELLKHVTAAIQDQQTPGGVKATYEQLLELCNQQRQALAQQAQEVERLKRKLAETENKNMNLRQIRHELDEQLTAMTTERDAAQQRYERQCAGTKSRIEEVVHLRGDCKQLQAKLTASEQECDHYKQRKDDAYRERNQVVAALAKLFPSGIANTAIDGWDAEWHGCVYIDLPTGQVSWHYHDSQGDLFAGLPPYSKPWDGHDTAEKYRRLSLLQSSEQEAGRLRNNVELMARDMCSMPSDLYQEWLDSDSQVHFRQWLAERALKGEGCQGDTPPG